jgi:Uma2 family endonuclease
MAAIETPTPLQISPPIAPAQPPPVAGQRRLFTVDEYAAMAQSGVLKPDERLELIGGELRLMSPIGPLHAEVVRRLTVALVLQSQDQAILSVQNPLLLDDHTQPQPDLLLLKPRAGGYAASHPQPTDALLLIEVCDISLEQDRTEKLPRYAAAGISETWLVDLEKQQIEQYSQPNQGLYERKEVRKLNDEIRSLGTPPLIIAVKSLFT